MEGPEATSIVITESTEQAAQRRLAFRGALTARSRPARRLRSVDQATMYMAGVDEDVMAQCPWEAPRYSALGFAILLNAALSGLALYLALSAGLHTPKAYSFAAAGIWAALNLSLDRWLSAEASSRPPAAGRCSRLYPALL